MAMWNDYEKLAKRLDRIANAFERIADALEADRKDEPIIYGNKHNCIMTIFGECSYAETGCGDCAVVEKVRNALDKYEPKDEPFDKDINVRSKTEPQTDEFELFDREALILLIECQKERIAGLLAKDEPITQMKTQNSNFKRTMRDCYNCKRYVTEGECIECHYEPKDEPQTENLFTDKDGDVWEWRGDAWYCISGDEPQTERSE